MLPTRSQIIVIRNTLAGLDAEHFAEYICGIGRSVHYRTSARADPREKFSFMNREAGHAAPFFDLLRIRFAGKPGLPSLRRIEPFYHRPAWLSVVATDLRAWN